MASFRISAIGNILSFCLCDPMQRVYGASTYTILSKGQDAYHRSVEAHRLGASTIAAIFAVAAPLDEQIR